MRATRMLLQSAVVAGGLGVGLGFGLAQDAGDDATPGEATTTVEQPASLSGQEMIAQGEQILASGGGIARVVSRQLDASRRESDIIRVTCLNDKLTQINANLRTAEGRLESLRSAVEGANQSLANHEFTVLTVLGQKFTVLEQEANQCIDQGMFDTGATRVTTTVDPGTPDDTVIDPTTPSTPPVLLVPDIPEPSSPAT